MDYDVVVVGAGPAGSMAAKYAAKHGAETALLEEHYAVGEPVECAGLVSVRALEECEVEPGSFVNRKITGAFFYSPECNSIPIEGRETKDYVIERRIFDRALATNAVRAGAELLLKNKVVNIRRDGKKQILNVISDDGPSEVTCGVVIGADGLKSKIAKLSGLGNVKIILPGAQIEGLYEPEDPNFVEMFVGRDVAPGFFAWSIPTEDGFARIGLCSTGSPLDYLEKNLSSHPIISKRFNGSVTDFVVGGDPIGPLKRTISDGVMIVGDAAGQVKPTSGGGIYTGAVCAKIAGEVAVKAVFKGDTSINGLLDYEKRWRLKIGRELKIGMLVHRAFERWSDDDFNDFVNFLSEPEILELVTEYGDVDYPSVLIRKLFGVLTPSRFLKILKIGINALI
ncbi:MAG: NAD(P)/FAD-dependent oxidoreductase [Halobacteriota archaeon]|nr:NAD(P)/FAD-dependent oxidoreductase [Halobacteriota archaeon]